MKRIIWAALLLAPGGPAAASAGSAVAEQSLPNQIAHAIAPEGPLRAKVAANYDTGFDRALAADPKAKAAEARHPGVMAAGKDAGRRAALATFDAHLPALYTRVAALFGDNLDYAGQRELLDFLRSPVVAAMRSPKVALVDEAKLDAEVNAGVKAGKPQVTGEQLRGAVDPGYIDRLSPDQRAQLMAFGASPTGRELARLTPALNDLVARWISEVLADQVTAVRTASTGAVHDFLARPAPVGGK